MSVQYIITSGGVALAAATAKTVLEGVVGASVNPPEWISLDITTDSVNAGAAPLLVEIGTYTATGTGTAYTPKRAGAAVGSSSSTWKTNMTAEGTGFSALAAFWMPPTMPFFYQWPLSRELLHSVSTVMGIRITAPAVVNVRINLTIEE